MNVDWDEAPQGAEAGHSGGEGLYPAWFRKDVAGLVEQICPAAGIKTWTWMGGRKDFPPGAVLRPTIRLGQVACDCQWNGEGLPPVGSDVEIDHSVAGGGISQVTIIAHIRARNLDCAVYQKGDDVSYASRGAFKPIRTPEQIAAEAKLEAAKELYCAINWNDGAEQWERLSVSRKGDYLKAIEGGWGRVIRA